jgi:hypothetical protein
MECCAHLEIARFGGARWGSSVFFGCHHLKEVHVARVVVVERNALKGSFVKTVISLGSLELVSEQLDAALALRWGWRDYAPTPARLSTSDEVELRSLSALVVAHMDAALSDGSNDWLASVDLSGLGALPPRLTLAHSPLLETVVLPSLLERLPGRFFEGCWRLVTVKLSHCSKLRVLGYDADWSFSASPRDFMLSPFIDCPSLERLELPSGVESVSFDGSGLRCLDLRGLSVTLALVSDCLSLERVVASRTCELGYAVSAGALRSAEFGQPSAYTAKSAVRVGVEVRYTGAAWTRWGRGMGGAVAEPVSWEKCGLVFAETSCLAMVEGRPFLPC